MVYVAIHSEQQEIQFDSSLVIIIIIVQTKVNITYIQ